MSLPSKKVIISALIVLGVGVVLFSMSRRAEYIPPSPIPSPTASSSTTPEVSITSAPASGPHNPLTDEACANATRRPIAVMLSGDAIARPLSGINEADMVIEMPVITGSITRFMAVFVCRDPIEIGSVRSARHDFIPLARGLDAIYAHWGGSHFALDLLKTHAVDNIDALPNPVNAFYRKDSAPAPHNGFTSMTRLLKASRFLNYRLESKTPAYPHSDSPFGTTSSTVLHRDSSGQVGASGTRPATSLGVNGTLEIGFPGSFRVVYQYDPEKHAYLRLRGGSTERDKNTGDEVWVRNVVVMRAVSRQIEGDYNDVKLEGSGNAAVYRDGKEIAGQWEKDAKSPNNKLTFRDSSGTEIPFAPGNIWIEITEPYTYVAWQAI